MVFELFHYWSRIVVVVRAVPSVGAVSEVFIVGCASSSIYIAPTVRPERVAVWYLIETLPVAAEAIALGAVPTLRVFGVHLSTIVEEVCDQIYVHGFILQIALTAFAVPPVIAVDCMSVGVAPETSIREVVALVV